MIRFLSRYKELTLTMDPATNEKKGSRIRFEDGRYTATTKKEIDFLRSYAAKNPYVTEVADAAAETGGA